jgi:chemotaxis protein MotB
MAMFIALFAISNVNDAKFKALARGFSTALGGGKLDAGIGGDGKATDIGDGNGQGNGPFTGGTLTPTNSALNAKELSKVLGMISSNSVAKAQQQATLTQVEQAIKAAATAQGFGGDLGLKLENRGLVVTLVTDQVLFDSGHATLRPEGFPLLTAVGDSLKSIDNSIEINGYTDNVNISTAEFPSNDELSAFRAIAVEHFFESLGLPEGRLRPTGLGARDPIASNSTDAGRRANRRVEIIIESDVVSQTLEQAGLNDKIATTPKQGSLNPDLGKPVGKPVDGTNPSVNPNLGAS